MNTAFISVLAAGSHLNATIGAVTLTIGKVFNAWVIVAPEKFDAAIEDESTLRPIDSEDRHKAYKSLVKENWPRCSALDAFNQMWQMMKDCSITVTVWDEDATSYIDAHAMLWTYAPNDRPALRRLEGDVGNLHMGSVFTMAAIDAGSRAQCNLNQPLMRAVKCSTIVRQAIDRIWPGNFTREIKEPACLKGTFDPDARLPGSECPAPIFGTPAGLKLPTASPATIKLPGAAPDIKLPGGMPGLKLPE